MKYLPLLLICLLCFACLDDASEEQTATIADEMPFLWENATIYFMLIDRFHNGDPSNDQNFDRNQNSGVLRGFEGGDIKGITQKLEEGYFTDLGVSALWITPPVEQVHGWTDEGSNNPEMGGRTYGYHGYWTRDWTAIDPNFGTMDDLKEMISKAHEKKIRVLLDVVINHTGPVTEDDSQWPDEWVRTSPKCRYIDFETTVTCTLVDNLPDIRTESDDPVALPPFLAEKWKAEGRYEREVAELDAFFERTGFPRSPRHYIIKWLIDFILDLGIDGYRVDTVKHTEPYVWKELYEEAVKAFEEWKTKNPARKLDDTPFYMMGEVYNYFIGAGQEFDMGSGDTVNFYQEGFNSLINFDLRSTQAEELDALFTRYSRALHGGPLQGYSVVNYISSHDDGSPFDLERNDPKGSATRLLLTPGATQIYYGDEVARPLVIEGANGDANLRSTMDWENVDQDPEAQEILEHWRKLAKFREAHPAVGAGRHTKLSDFPYAFKREVKKGSATDKVIVIVNPDREEFFIGAVFDEGTRIKDYYSGKTSVVTNGMVTFGAPGELLLLGT